MTDDMNKRKQELSGEYINEAIPHTLRDEPAWHYSVIDFEKGFDAGVAEMQKQIDELKKSNTEMSDLIYSEDGYIASQDEMRKQIDELKNEIRKWSELYTLTSKQYDRAEKERDSLKAQLEKYQIDVDWYENCSRIAIDALKDIKEASVKGDETTTELNCFHLADDALTQIKSLQNDKTQTNGGE